MSDGVIAFDTPTGLGEGGLSQKPTCLIVEDQALLGLALEAYLEEVGFGACEVVSSSKDALEWLVTNVPTMAILDYNVKDVRTRAGDNLVVHQALEHIRLGDVLVVDGGGDVSRALIGEIMTTIARTRGAAGIIVDGAVRDAAALSRSDFPVYARAANHRGPYKDGPGEINVPVSIGGLVIAPGDVVVGDEDGIVAFHPSIAADLLKSVRRQEAREAEIIRSIQEGSYKGSYSKSINSAV